MFLKPKTKRRRAKIHNFSKKVKQQEYDDAKGICRICNIEPITQYHHINEKGMGGGRGLGICINCLGVGDKCHNHDDTEFLKKANEILRKRINKIFGDYEYFNKRGMTERIGISLEELEYQINKGFLKESKITGAMGIYLDCTYSIYYRDDVKRWLGVYE